MNLNEIEIEYNKTMYEAKKVMISKKNEWLKEHHIDGKVIQKKDGKIGWLEVAENGLIYFFPMTKKGKKSLSSTGYVWQSNINVDYAPYEE